ncbi:MAG: type II toxin-antitoxin system PemK/MazF family toxin [Bacteroidota bacterium]
MKKGDIVLIPFPFTNLSGQKNRPALVLVSTETDLTVAFITSQLKWADECDLAVEPSPTNGLKSISLIRLSTLSTIDKNLALGRLGALSLNELNRKTYSTILTQAYWVEPLPGNPCACFWFRQLKS